MAKILLFGATGQLGYDLDYLLKHTDHMVCSCAHTSNDSLSHCEMKDTGSIRRHIICFQPDVIINATGYNDVDGAETNINDAYALNAEAVRVMGEEAKWSKMMYGRQALLIHYSTNFVFDGNPNGARLHYLEDDKTNPISVYGASKLQGEKYLLEMGAPAIILRTSWLMGMRTNNFMTNLIKRFERGDLIELAYDQYAYPTLSYDLAAATIEIMNICLKSKHPENYYGIYNATNTFEEHDFSQRGINKLNVAKDILSAYISAQDIYNSKALSSNYNCVGAPSCHFDSAATRPTYAALGHSKMLKIFGLTLRDWRYSITRELSNYYYTKNHVNRIQHYLSKSGSKVVYG